MTETETGFIVHSYIPYRGRTFYLIGRLENGRTFALLVPESKPFFFIRESQLAQAGHIPAPRGMHVSKSAFSTMDKEPVVSLEFANDFDVKRYAQELQAAGVRTYESDIKKMDRFNLARRLHSAVHISGEYTPGHHVDRIYRNPRLSPARWDRPLRILAIDIETDREAAMIRAISLSGSDPWGEKSIDKVLFKGSGKNEEWIDYFDGEKELLTAFAENLTYFDPDIITGWNVIDFDFKVIWERFKAHRIPFNLGRSSESSSFLPAGQGGNNKIIISGRQVIDAMWLVRSSSEHYDDYSLNTVARQLLDLGKEVELQGKDKLEELDRLYYQQPEDFCQYCLTDSRLVLQILEKTGLVALTLKRCMLTGTSLDRAWTSIAPFDHLYTEHLHARSQVAPDLGVDQEILGRSPGGLILGPEAGFFKHVMIFDFKSLYPSIILTFNIDPASFLFVDNDNKAPGTCIKAPNQACFTRDPGILPSIIAEFFAKREEAKQNKDKIASYVYKILMNSFYGVLGSTGCRFGSSHLAGAITGFGQKLLYWCKQYLTDNGHRVIYGDTDSLFVIPPDTAGCTREDLFNIGTGICAQVNVALTAHIKEEYNLDSRLVLEFEKIYESLFIPAVRTLAGSHPRGRAKGYAGLIMDRSGSKDELEIKGMEAVRSDWTELAHQFQRELLLLFFNDQGEKEIKQYIHSIRKQLFDGHFDSKLVYRKVLRNPPSSYTKIKPPHVRAAELAGWKNKKGRINYVMTHSGPEPVDKTTAPLDYQHYLEKQLKPIALSAGQARGYELEICFDPDAQGTLFDDLL